MQQLYNSVFRRPSLKFGKCQQSTSPQSACNHIEIMLLFICHLFLTTDEILFYLDVRLPSWSPCWKICNRCWFLHSWTPRLSRHNNNNLHHHHHYHHHLFNDHFLPRSIKGMVGCFQTAYKVDNQPLATLGISCLVIVTLPFRENPFSHHQAVVYSIHGNVGASFWWWDALPHTNQGLWKRRWNLVNFSWTRPPYHDPAYFSFTRTRQRHRDKPDIKFKLTRWPIPRPS